MFYKTWRTANPAQSQSLDMNHVVLFLFSPLFPGNT